MKKRGRKSLEERFGYDKIIKAYKMHGTLRKTAEILGVSHVALLLFFRKHEIKTKNRSEAMRIAHRDSPHTSTFAKFLKENQGIMLPRNYTKLMQLSGCNKNTITCYLYRRRWKVKNILKNLPNLKSVNACIVDELGNMYNTMDFSSYEYLIDKFTMKVKIFALLKGKEQIVIPVPDLEFFIETVKNLPIVEKSNHRQSSVSLSKPETLSSDLPDQDTQEISERIGTGYFRGTFEGIEAVDRLSEYNPQG